MEAVVFVSVLAAFALLAIRRGADHPRSARDVSDPSATHDPAPDRSAPFGENGAVRAVAATGTPHPFPTLALIERASGDEAGTLTESLHAAHLEERAEALVAEFWSDTVWVTGLVSATALRGVRDALAREISARDNLVTVLSVPVPFAADPANRVGVIAPPVRVA